MPTAWRPADRVAQASDVSDVDHPWVHTDPEAFVGYMDFLRDDGCCVIAMRDLAVYVDRNRLWDDPHWMTEKE